MSAPEKALYMCDEFLKRNFIEEKDRKLVAGLLLQIESTKSDAQKNLYKELRNIFTETGMGRKRAKQDQTEKNRTKLIFGRVNK